MTHKYISETTSHARAKLFSAVAAFIGWVADADCQFRETQSKIHARCNNF